MIDIAFFLLSITYFYFTSTYYTYYIILTYVEWIHHPCKICIEGTSIITLVTYFLYIWMNIACCKDGFYIVISYYLNTYSATPSSSLHTFRGLTNHRAQKVVFVEGHHPNFIWFGFDTGGGNIWLLEAAQTYSHQ